MLSNYPIHSIQLINDRIPIMLFQPLLFHLQSPPYSIYIIQKPKQIFQFNIPHFDVILSNQLAQPIFQLPYDNIGQFTRDVIILNNNTNILKSLSLYHSNFTSYQFPENIDIQFNQALPIHLNIIEYHPANQHFYLQQDLSNISQFVHHPQLKQALAQVKTLSQLKSLVDIIDLPPSKQSQEFYFQNYQLVRDIKLTEEMYQIYNDDHSSEQQLLLFILLENYVNNIKIKPNYNPSIANYWIMFMKKEFNIVDQIELNFLKKNFKNLETLQFNKAFALELQEQNQQALDKFKKLYLQTTNHQLKVLITQRMARIHENLKNQDETLKLQLLLLHQNIKEKGFTEELHQQLLELQTNESFYLKLGVRLEMSLNKEFPLLQKYLTQLSHKERKSYILKLIKSTDKELFFKLSFECRKMILLTLFDNGYLNQLNILLEFLMENLKQFGFQDHDFILQLFLKVMYASGLLNGVENRIKMIKQEYSEQKRHLGGIDFDYLHQLGASINHCKYCNIPGGLKEMDFESFYLKYKYHKQNHNYRQMHDKFNNLKQKDNAYLYKVLLTQGKKGLIEIKNQIKNSIEDYGIQNLKTARLIYYYSKLLRKVGMYCESLKEFKTYLRLIISNLNEHSIQIIMTCLKYKNNQLPEVFSLDYQVKLMLMKVCFGYQFKKEQHKLRRIFKCMMQHGQFNFTQEFMHDYLNQSKLQLITSYKFNLQELIQWIDDL